ncbi:GNAT family N-acetyltransferase [Salimicrobium halophilum]|uniref:Predicted N-acetyltransferase YhbS n=1 Tax=Salimicrobium halophilum TaxID=86666 RepID=A0A1G8QX26_9BACI|nr:N-acetyltransferase [Salimicrobium halophilum]SDJ09258.1 Predicted N-acetyltransferase YhbS [Salimicrobium halophilum]
MKIQIRQENPQDYKAVETVAREAFWNLYFPGCHEHYVIHKMRDHEDFNKDLSFVIEVDGEIVGGIFYTHSKIVADDGEEYRTVSFGPVFLAPDFQGKGLGRKLITHSIQAAKDQGHRAILTLGYPYHYEPYGFLGGKKYDISMPDGKFYKGLLALPLYEGALNDISGYVVFSDVLEADDKEVDEFDQSFPPKEKKVQESQREFEEVSAMLDE